MPSSSSFEALEPRQSLDRAQCTALGERLTAARAARHLTVDEVSKTLLLSPRQVRALEVFEVQPFHNATFYLNALRKYAAFCGIDEGLIARLETTRPETPESMDRPAAPLEDTGELLRRKGMVSAAIVAAIVVGGAVWNLSRSRAVSPGAATVVANVAPVAAPVLPEAPVPVTAPVPAPPIPQTTEAAGITESAESRGPVEPVTSVGQSSEAGGTTAADVTPGEPTIPEPQQLAPALTPTTRYGSFRANQKAWMFLRQSDNSVIERTLAAGEVVQLRTKPRYLALGTADVEVTLGDVSVDTGKFVRNGTLRMGVAEFTTAEESTLVTPASAAPLDSPLR